MSATKLHDLISLAREPSSERRRELLREVTNLFFNTDAAQPGEMALFDDILVQLAGDMEEAVRVELSERMAASNRAPPRLVVGLANDIIAVAKPVLSGSSHLSEEDQLKVARTHGQEHLRALSQRQGVSTTVTDAIVERADDATVGVLLRNQSAELSRKAQENVVDRAQTNPELHEAVVDRHGMPADLLNEMYFMVEAKLRDRIMEKNAELDPDELEKALIAGRKQVATRDGALPADFAEAEAAIRGMRLRRGLTPQSLAAMLRNGERTKFLVALADMADVDFSTARRILEKKQLDALAIICKAADFDRALFLTFAVLILDREVDAMGRAREYGALYQDLPKDTALRTLRFWRMRRQTGDVAA
ncbi:MAG TPA: DUF2336 domain-containing protein [Caulobacteraceae bacterium]|nr:DUF2336 domain-containing protein [Caulobacteraceae bacterium]